MEKETAVIVLEVLIEQMRIWEQHPAELMQQYQSRLGNEYRKKWQALCVEALKTAIDGLLDC